MSVAYTPSSAIPLIFLVIKMACQKRKFAGGRHGARATKDGQKTSHRFRLRMNSEIADGREVWKHIELMDPICQREHWTRLFIIMDKKWVLLILTHK
jgi:hypothetical protein